MNDYFDSNYDLFKTKNIIEVYPHSSDYQQDLLNCDEFGYELIPVHSELWYERRKDLFERKRNSDLLSKGQELLSYLRKHVNIDRDSARALALALTYDLTEKEGLGYVSSLIQDLDSNSYDNGDDHYEPVPGINDTINYHDYSSIFPSKYTPLPDISGCTRTQIGLSDIRVPTNTSLNDTVISPTQGKSMREYRQSKSSRYTSEDIPF